jgi:hypothetical protein
MGKVAHRTCVTLEYASFLPNVREGCLFTEVRDQADGTQDPLGGVLISPDLRDENEVGLGRRHTTFASVFSLIGRALVHEIIVFLGGFLYR